MYLHEMTESQLNCYDWRLNQAEEDDEDEDYDDEIDYDENED